MNFKSFYWALIILIFYKSDFSIVSAENNELRKSSNYLTNLDKINLFDGSEIGGQMIRLDANRNLFWENSSILDKIKLNYESVSSIHLNRTRKIEDKKDLNLHLFFVNGDNLKCKLKELTNSELTIESEFSEPLKIPINFIKTIKFLPPSYKILFDSSFDLGSWKKSNTKSWTIKNGDFVSVFSGSTGTTLPKKNALEISFQAEWERSFYLAVRLFSDSDGSSYGNVGYHLSFSNERLNLQLNKRLKGRIVRETLGSLVIPGIMKEKQGEFRIITHRKRKEFIIFVNGQEMARWKDSTTDFFPDGNGILFINQGGNSFIKLKSLNISGWDGSSFPVNGSKHYTSEKSPHVIFQNGDSTITESITGNDKSITIETIRGNFEFPPSRLQSINYKSNSDIDNYKDPSEFMTLNKSLGHLSFDINLIDENNLIGTHPFFGKFKIPIHLIKFIKCNQNISKLRKYWKNMELVKNAIIKQDPLGAISLLEEQDLNLRSWYWKRLYYLSKSMIAEEELSFTPHPESTLASAKFTGSNNLVLTTQEDGKYTLWNGHAKLASGSFSEKFISELGRLPNEVQHSVSINYPYWLSESEITQGQYNLIMLNHDKNNSSSNYPVICNWEDAQEYCRKLNDKTEIPTNGYKWRLPTEAEWERACRGESMGAPFFESANDKKILPTDESYRKHLNKYGWFAENSSGKVHKVKQKQPNDLGLYDMHGNVWEWCLDSIMMEKSKLLSNRTPGRVNPLINEGNWKILKGGCFDVGYERCRTGYRGANSPNIVMGDRGFRLALAPDLSKKGVSFSKIEKHNIFESKNFKLKMLPVSPKTFLMGSKSLLTSPKAIPNSVGDGLILGSLNGTVGITDFSGNPIHKICELNSSITSISEFIKGELIIAGCENGNLFVIDKRKSKVGKVPFEHKFPVTCIDISTDGKSFCTTGLDGKLICHSFPDYKQNWMVRAVDHNISMDFVEYNKKGNLILVSSLGSLPKLFYAKNGVEVKIQSFPYRDLIISRFLPRSNSFVSITKDGMLIFTECNQGLVYKIIKTGINDVLDFSFSTHGKKIIISSTKGQCYIFKNPNNETISVFNQKGEITSSPDFYFILANKTKPKKTGLKDFLTEYGIKQNNLEREPQLDISSDNRFMVSCLDQSLRIWCYSTGSWLSTLGDKLISPFTKCSFSPDGNDIIAKLESGEILIYPTKEIEQLNPYPADYYSVLDSWFNSN